MTTTTDDIVRVAIRIAATPETVWTFLAQPDRFAAWIGAFAGQPPLPGTSIDPQPGGKLRVAYPGGRNTALGEVLELEPPRRILFSWGYSEEAQGVPAGSTRVEITLTPIAGGTRVELCHTGLPTPQHRDGHRGGWTHYLSMLALQAAAAQHAEAATRNIAAYFAAFAEADPTRRRQQLEACCTTDVVVRSSFACTDSLSDLDAHIANARRHMPGVTLAPTGETRQLHGHATAAWEARGPDASTLMKGSLFAQLAEDGRLARIVTFM